EILTDDTRKNKYYVVLPKSAKGVELYTSKNDKQVVTYTAK
ncbi:protein MobB, partial [Escherichia coli]|nr:protein MobB [Escherichia coli]